MCYRVAGPANCQEKSIRTAMNGCLQGELAAGRASGLSGLTTELDLCGVYTAFLPNARCDKEQMRKGGGVGKRDSHRPTQQQCRVGVGWRRALCPDPLVVTSIRDLQHLQGSSKGKGDDTARGAESLGGQDHPGKESLRQLEGHVGWTCNLYELLMSFCMSSMDPLCSFFFSVSIVKVVLEVQQVSWGRASHLAPQVYIDFILGKHGSVPFGSVAQSCLTLCNPMDCSRPDLESAVIKKTIWEHTELKTRIV